MNHRNKLMFNKGSLGGIFLKKICLLVTLSKYFSLHDTNIAVL